MKPIILFLIKFLYFIFFVVVGIIYSFFYFIYDPKALIKEKKESATRLGPNHPIDWHKTLQDVDFWCPYIES